MEELEKFNYPPEGTASSEASPKTPAFLYEVKNKQFEIDPQTLGDLNLFNDHQNGSLLTVFSTTVTKGGNETLIRMLKTPVNNVGVLQTRADCFRFFSQNDINLKHSKPQMEMIEYYLALQAPLLKNDFLESIGSLGTNNSRRRNDNYIIKTGINKILLLLRHLNDVCEAIGTKEVPAYLEQSLFFLQQFIARPEITDSILSNTQPTSNDYRKLDRFFRKESKEYLDKVFRIVYEFEVFSAVAATVERHKLSFPCYLASNTPNVYIKGLFHPLIKKSIRNDFRLGNDQNLCVLTGANMSGKSTFLKSIGVAVYLSQTGFPVPAEYMETSVFNGLISAINLSDNLGKGYSHFYSEVRRIKYAAREIKERKKIIVILDEMFRGTNVKEAYEASLMITSAFAKIKSSLFLISTHITEIAEKLKEDENIIMKYFESNLERETLVYTHKIKDGISSDRVGLRIIQNEKILEILDEAINA